jgi:hypothetical protein
LGKRLSDDILNEAVKLRMEGDSYREIAAKLHLRSYTSLEPHLKGVPKGVRKGSVVVEVPVSGNQEPPAETEKPTKDTKLEPSDGAASAVAEAIWELARSLQALTEEVAKRSEEGQSVAAPESYAYPGGMMRAKMMEDEINTLKAAAKAQSETLVEVVKNLVGRIETLETRVAFLMVKSMQ